MLFFSLAKCDIVKKLEGIMERNYANLIYMNGLQYHKKTIEYEEWTDSIEINSFQTTRFSAHNVSKILENAMARESVHDIRFILRRENPYCLERTTYDGVGTKKMIIVADNALVVKNGTFMDQKIFSSYQRYVENHPVTDSYMTYYNIDMFDVFKKEEYQKIIHLFEKMMDGTVLEEHLRQACSVVSNDVYLELLYALKDIAGRPVSKKISIPAREKVKKLSEYYN